MSSDFRLTVRRRDSLALVRSELVQRDLEQGCWLINGNPARRWHGRTLSELEQAKLIEAFRDGSTATTASMILTAEGKAALTR
jgi:hypothetical protein